MESIFSAVDNVNPTSESNRSYFLPGKYKVRLENVLIHKKRLGGNLFVVETTCLESDNPEILPGETRNWVQPMDTDAAMPRIKTFMGAAHGFCPKRNLDALSKFVTKEVCEKAVSDENPLKNKELKLECHNKKSMKTGKDFTVHLWLP
ncbi:MAG: hypothetical protein WCK49_11085 [Myxococcaceae bacterium]